MFKKIAGTALALALAYASMMVCQNRGPRVTHHAAQPSSLDHSMFYSIQRPQQVAAASW